MRTRKLALTEGTVAGILFGTASIFARALFIQGLTAFDIAFWRLIIACITLAVPLFVLGKFSDLKIARKNLKELVILSFFLGLHFIFFVSAVEHTTILNATVLVNTTPIFSTFISTFLFKLRPSRVAVVGLIISFIGVCAIGFVEAVTLNTDAPSEVSAPLWGDLAAVLAAFVEAIYLNYGRNIRNQIGVLATMLPIYLLTAIVVGAFSILFSSPIVVLPTGSEILLPLLGLGLLPTAVAHTLYFSSLSNLKSFETATMALLEPVGATLLGVALFHEIPTPLFVVGSALILLGIFFIVKEKS